jgi:hypothetical protein
VGFRFRRLRGERATDIPHPESLRTPNRSMRLNNARSIPNRFAIPACTETVDLKFESHFSIKTSKKPDNAFPGKIPREGENSFNDIRMNK